MEYFIHTFSGGLRLVHKYTDSPVAHAGVIIGSGSRNELEDEHGMAHLVEHCLFKGTLKRKATAILRRMEDVGSDLNAFTSREEIFIHASFLSRYYPRALELFSDLLFHSVYPSGEIEKEKGVIREEIKSVRDNPYEMIHDHFDSLLFPGHPLGRSILGSAKTLRKIGRDDILRFVSRHFIPGNMAIVSVGRAKPSELIRWISAIFPVEGPSRDAAVQGRNPEFNPPLPEYVPFRESLNLKSWQTHCVIGIPSYSYHDGRRVPMALLNNIAGGPAMSSVLNLELREKRGRVYTVESHYSPYHDTGSLTIYLGTDGAMLDDSIDLVSKILLRFSEKPLSGVALKRFKNQFAGQAAIGFDSNYHQMSAIAKSLLVYGKVETYGEVKERIMAVSPEMMQEVAAEVFNPSKMSILVYKSKK